MAEELYGIEQTKDAFSFGASVVSAIERAGEDGKLDIKTDFIHFIDPLTKLPAFITDADEIPKELGDLSDGEMDELRELFGGIVDDPDWRDVFHGVLLLQRGASKIIGKKRASE